MPKVAFVGAGSTVFAKNLIGDILGFPALRDTTTLALMDIDPERLRTSEVVAHRVAEALGSRATVESTTDRRAALDGADYVVTMMQVGGYRPATVTDFEVPKRYGLRQTIADTLGVGGIMRALRTIPSCSTSAATWRSCAPTRSCSSTSTRWSRTAGPWPRRRRSAASASATPCSTPRARSRRTSACRRTSSTTSAPASTTSRSTCGSSTTAPTCTRACGRCWRRGACPRGTACYELFRHFGYFVTESSEHFAEYCPWFIKDGRPDLIEEFNVPLDAYLRRCEEQIAGWHELRDELERGEGVEVRRSAEYGGQIVNAIDTGEPFTSTVTSRTATATARG